MAINRVVIASRESKLALWQANYIRDCLIKAHPALEVSLLGITTSGDSWLSAPLSEIGGKGLFVKELETAIFRGDADIAVHSVKDVPAQLPDEFELPVLGFRDDPRDAFVTQHGESFWDLPAGARIGTSSERRKAQLNLLRSDLKFRDIRGNIDTRLKKLDTNQYDGLVLASAGLNRLGLQARVADYLEVEACLPAAGQGALAIECRRGDERILELLEPLRGDNSSQEVEAERMISAKLDADCSVPLGAYATCIGSTIFLRAFLGKYGGNAINASAKSETPEAVSDQVVEELLAQGAKSLLSALKSARQ